jgi:hypothetical protein
MQERMEPFCNPKVTDNPGEVDLRISFEQTEQGRKIVREKTDLGQPRRFRIIEVVHTVPDGLQNPALPVTTGP